MVIFSNDEIDFWTNKFPTSYYYTCWKKITMHLEINLFVKYELAEGKIELSLHLVWNTMLEENCPWDQITRIYNMNAWQATKVLK